MVTMFFLQNIDFVIMRTNIKSPQIDSELKLQAQIFFLENMVTIFRIILDIYKKVNKYEKLYI
jgi:hypothetical protein